MTQSQPQWDTPVVESIRKWCEATAALGVARQEYERAIDRLERAQGDQACAEEELAARLEHLGRPRRWNGVTYEFRPGRWWRAAGVRITRDA